MAKAKAKGGKKKRFKARTKKSVPVGVIHIQATFNNTIVTVSDPDGKVIRRKGVVRVICENPKHKQRQG